MTIFQSIDTQELCHQTGPRPESLISMTFF